MIFLSTAQTSSNPLFTDVMNRGCSDNAFGMRMWKSFSRIMMFLALPRQNRWFTSCSKSCREVIRNTAITWHEILYFMSLQKDSSPNVSVDFTPIWCEIAFNSEMPNASFWFIFTIISMISLHFLCEKESLMPSWNIVNVSILFKGQVSIFPITRMSLTKRMPKMIFYKMELISVRWKKNTGRCDKSSE